MKKYPTLTKTAFVKLMIRMQDEGNIESNAFATAAIKKYGLEKLHAKLTGQKYPDHYKLIKD